MTHQPVLKTPRVSVLVAAADLDATRPDDELLEVVVQTDNRDTIAWDMHRNREKWPSGPDAPMLWMTFLAWSALRRADEPYRSMSFDRFSEVVRSVSKPDDGATEAGVEGEAVDPTHAGAVPA